MSKQKNLLFVFADQWRADAMGYAHSDPVFTPNMDAFCTDATYCDHAFSTFPLCSPHRASLITGKYPFSLGFFTNCKPSLSMRLEDSEIGIAEVAAANGYQTAYIGKWHLDEPEINHSSQPLSGATDWDAFTPPGVRRHSFEYWYSYGTYDMHLNPHYWQDTPEMICPGTWSVEHETNQAIHYLKNVRQQDQPFMMFLSWNPPHSPYEQVPQRYLDLYPDVQLKENVTTFETYHHTWEPGPQTEEELRTTTRQYYAAVSGLDDQFGRLIQFLKDEGLYDDTVIVLSADHGDMMGSHGLIGKHVWFEESIHIPFVVRTGETVKPFCHTCIGSQDMMPTLLGLLDIPIPDTVEGEDCSSYITTNAEDFSRISYLCATPGRAPVVEMFQQHGKDPKAYGWRGLRSQNHTYIMELGYDVKPQPKRYLYDLTIDPLQLHPLSLENTENLILARSYEDSVLCWLQNQKDDFAALWKLESDSL